MDILHHLALGLGVALAPANLLYVLMGCTVGALIGVLPGIGPVAAIAMLLPATYYMPPLPALVLLAGIYCGSGFGGTIAAVVAQLQGPSAPVAAGIEGYQMARQGRAGPALLAAATGAFFAVSVAVLVLAAVVAPLAVLAAQFGPAEYFSLMVLGLVAAVVLAPGALLKALAMAVLGLLMGQLVAGGAADAARFGFGMDMPALTDGVGFLAIAMGVWGYGEVIANLAGPEAARHVFPAQLRSLWPSRKDVRDMLPAVLRGTALGSALGLLPGAGVRRAASASYAMEKKVHMQNGGIAFGKGNIRGVTGPGAAHHAGAQTSFTALLALGIPPNAALALMLGAMALHHIQPGPQVLLAQPGLVWGLVVSLWIGHGVLMLLSLPLIGIGAWLLRLPYRYVFPFVILVCALGVYGISHQVACIWLVAGLGCMGYLFHKLGCPPAPLLLGMVLGPAMEVHLRNALLQSGGDWSVLLSHGLSAGLLAVAALLLLLVLMPGVRYQREEAMADD
jgi:putative tricarboxylic transport membrane protein